MIVVVIAIEEIEQHLGTDAEKAERKWHEKDDEDKNWKAFKQYWKEEVHRWDMVKSKLNKRKANAAATSTQIDELSARPDALQTENMAYRERNDALMSEQIEIRNALRAEASQRQFDEMSSISYRSGYTDAMKAHGSASRTGTPSSGTTRCLWSSFARSACGKLRIIIVNY